MSEPILALRHVSKTFPGIRALNGVSLTLARGEILAVLGQNGSGKSTLVKILAGVYEPDGGAEFDFHGVGRGSPDEHVLHFIHQDLGLVPTLTGLENLGLRHGLNLNDLRPVARRAERKRAEALLERLGARVDLTKPVADLAPSEKTLIAIARALDGWTRNDNVLVLDEPTAALHGAEAEVLFDAVRRVAAAGAGVIFISHRLDEVIDLADRVMVLRDGHVVAESPVDDIDTAWLVRQIAGRELLGLDRTQRPMNSRAALTLRGLNGPGIAGVDLDVAVGEIVGVTGILGSGREHLAPMICGAVTPQSGQLSVCGKTLTRPSPRACIRAGLAYVPAHRVRDGAVMTMSAAENLTLPRLRDFIAPGWWLRRTRERAETARWFARFDIRPATPSQTLQLFSGGNQQKVVLAKWMRNDPHVLIVDEPTQGIDVGSKASIYEAIGEAARQGLAILVVSSDAKELASLCHRALVLRDGQVVAELADDKLTESALLELAHSTARADAYVRSAASLTRNRPKHAFQEPTDDRNR